METLVELAEKYKPTKMWHGYMPAFDMHFAPLRNAVQRVLEIGVETGVSLRMWEEYFPNAEIVGLDINPKCRRHGGGRRTIAIGSQGDRAVLQGLGDFDVIIDDGSHKPDHQIGTFNEMFLNNLSIGGLFVIEDVETVKHQKTWDFVKELVDQLNYLPPGYKGRDWPKLNHFPENAPALAKMITAIHVYRYLVFIEKGRNPEEGEAARRLAK